MPWRLEGEVVHATLPREIRPGTAGLFRDEGLELASCSSAGSACRGAEGPTELLVEVTVGAASGAPTGP